jgi:hypothetical protein
MKYSFSLNESGVIGPQMSVWINSRGLVDENLDFSNCLLICFPITHPSQNLFSKSRFDSPCIDCFFTKILRPLYPRCLNLMCHNQASSSLLILRHSRPSRSSRSWLRKQRERRFGLWDQIEAVSTCPTNSSHTVWITGSAGFWQHLTHHSRMASLRERIGQSSTWWDQWSKLRKYQRNFGPKPWSVRCMYKIDVRVHFSII